MSYRELRDFTEMMRSLGYQRLISLENFRTPNFELVADILYWIVKRYDPTISIPDAIESEDDRVEFLSVVAQQVQAKAWISLNVKHLYAADGHGVKEVLKLAELLYRASKAKPLQMTNTDSEVMGRANAGRIPTDVHRSRELSSEILTRGALLYDLLGAEQAGRESRQQALAFLDIVNGTVGGTAENRYIESSLRELVSAAEENLETARKQFAELEADERGLDGKMNQKTQELERLKGRLRTLKAVRPSFMDEYEGLEVELQQLYGAYTRRYRNLAYMEKELDRYDTMERDRARHSEREQRRFKKEVRKKELEQLRGDNEVADIAIDSRIASQRLGKDRGNDSESTASSTEGGEGSDGHTENDLGLEYGEVPQEGRSDGRDSDSDSGLDDGSLSAEDGTDEYYSGMDDSDGDF